MPARELLVGAASYLVLSNLAYAAIKDRCSWPLAVPRTCIQVFSLNEEDVIEESLRSIHEQHVVRRYPDAFKLQLYDGGSTDDTVRIARSMGFDVRVLPRGKLLARNRSVLENPDCVVHVHVDADTVLHPCWVQNALAELQRPGVVAVTSPRLYMGPEAMIMIPLRGFMNIDNRVYGSNCAVLHDVFMETLFDESYDGSPDMVIEEEINFYKRLRRYGEIAYIPTPAWTRPPTMKYISPTERFLNHHSPN